MCLRINTDHDIFVENALKVTGKTVKLRVHRDSKLSYVIPAEY